jgi:glucose/arabinose dehydrogenase
VVRRESLLTELNERVRDVRQGPDGWLYLLTDSPDGRVIRLER